MIDKSLENVEFPDSLEEIDYCAFSCYENGTTGTYVASNLKSVKFGTGLKTINNYAFYRNEKLETIEFLGNNLSLIGFRAFQDCLSLTELNLTGNNTVIDDCAFNNNYTLKI